MKVLIQGAGIAGTALSFWLSKLGHSVTVVERFPELRATGLQLDLRGPGVEVVRRMRLEEAFRPLLIQEQGLEIVDKAGVRRGFFPARKSGSGLQSFSTSFEVMRGSICRVIHDATKDRATFVFGRSLKKLEDKGGAVAVEFNDGTKDEFDLVVGADGLRSRTRGLMFPSSGTDTGMRRTSNAYMGYFTVASRAQPGEEYLATWYLGTESRFIMTRRHSPDTIQVYLSVDSDSARLKTSRPGDVEEEKAALAETFEGAGWRTDELLVALKTSSDFYLERVALVKLDSWSSGRVALVGDAAWAPSANTGMGTTSAMVGAYVLAGEISRHCRREDSSGLAEALKAYQETFGPFMERVQEGLLDGEGHTMPSGSFTISLLLWAVSIASALRLNVIGRLFLKEGTVKGWKLPDYEGMR